LAFYSLFCVSCNKKQQVSTSEFQLKDTLELSDTLEQVKQIVYQMTTPEDMAKIFSHSNVVYNAMLENSPANAQRYSSSYQAAVNLGVYGVDVCYARAFNKMQDVQNLLQSIRLLASQLGVPKKYYETMLNYSGQVPSKDSLAIRSISFYNNVNQHLNTNGQAGLAALTVYGAWVESLYILAHCSTSDTLSASLIEKVALQKYALQNLYNLLENYVDDVQIQNIQLSLKDIRSIYSKIEIRGDSSSTHLDRKNKTILSKNFCASVTVNDVREIFNTTNMLRALIIR